MLGRREELHSAQAVCMTNAFVRGVYIVYVHVHVHTLVGTMYVYMENMCIAH